MRINVETQDEVPSVISALAVSFKLGNCDEIRIARRKRRQDVSGDGPTKGRWRAGASEGMGRTENKIRPMMEVALTLRPCSSAKDQL
jgi:hypothetical protein